jgi:hypothetical protein
MNVPIDVAPNVERENLGARGDRNDIQLESDKGNNTKSKIIFHFIKRKLSLSPMEINFIIPNELKYLEGLVKLIRKKEMK